MARTIIDNPLFKKTESGDFGAVHLPVAAIQPSPHQARKVFADESIAELAESIRAVGMLQPIKVVKEGENYYLVYGERRLRALRKLGVAELIWDSHTQLAITPDPPNADLAVQSLTENILRENLSPIEEAEAYMHLKTLKGFKKQQQLAEYMGIDRRRISEKLHLLDLSDRIKQELIGRAGNVSASHVRELQKLEANEPMQLEVIRRVAEQGLSVKETSRMIAEIRRRMQKYDDAMAVAGSRDVRRRVEERKFLRRFDQLCHQFLRAWDVLESDDELKAAFQKEYGKGNKLLDQVQNGIRCMRGE